MTGGLKERMLIPVSKKVISAKDNKNALQKEQILQSPPNSHDTHCVS